MQESNTPSILKQMHKLTQDILHAYSIFHKMALHEINHEAVCIDMQVGTDFHKVCMGQDYCYFTVNKIFFSLNLDTGLL